MELDAAIAAFEAGPWGTVTTDRHAGGGICQRSSLALLAFLEQHGLADGVRLWRFKEGKPERERNPAGNHWVLEIDGEAIDVTAVQFDGEAGIRRYPIEVERDRWRSATIIDPEDPPVEERPDSWTGLHGMVPNWRDVLPAGPPGEIDGWPYFREGLCDLSPWHRRP